MRLIGGNSGFKSVRDLILFTLGMSIDIFHIVTTPSADLSIVLLLFGAGLAGSPYALRSDERSDDKEELDHAPRNRRSTDRESEDSRDD